MARRPLPKAWPYLCHPSRRLRTQRKRYLTRTRRPVGPGPRRYLYLWDHGRNHLSCPFCLCVPSDIPLSEDTPTSPDIAPTESMAEAASGVETSAIEDSSAEAGDSIVKPSIISWVNHVIYALVVALVYRRKGILNT